MGPVHIIAPGVKAADGTHDVVAALVIIVDTADMARRMAGRYRLPDALSRADILARRRSAAATMTGR